MTTLSQPASAQVAMASAMLGLAISMCAATARWSLCDDLAKEEGDPYHNAQA